MVRPERSLLALRLSSASRIDCAIFICGKLRFFVVYSPSFAIQATTPFGKKVLSHMHSLPPYFGPSSCLNLLYHLKQVIALMVSNLANPLVKKIVRMPAKYMTIFRKIARMQFSINFS